jgi:hypothetical protein
MLHNGQRSLADLGDFLAALRVNGVPVGPVEIDRLRQLFALEPRLERGSLKSLLSALLIKTPAQREAFEALFATWCPDHDADWPEEGAEQLHPEPSTSPPGQSPASPQQESQETTSKLPRQRIARRLLTAAVVLLLGVAPVWFLWPPKIVVEEVNLPPAPTLTGENDPDALPSTPVEHAWFWQAKVDPGQIHVPWVLTPLELASLSLLALALALVAWWRYAERFPSIKPTRRRYVGFGWQPLPPPGRDDTALIEARDHRQLVWNIEHFVSDDPTRRLDLDQTVDATARAGGFVHLHSSPPSTTARSGSGWTANSIGRRRA